MRRQRQRRIVHAQDFVHESPLSAAKVHGALMCTAALLLAALRLLVCTAWHVHGICAQVVAHVATAEKLEAADAELAHTGRMGRFTAPFEKRSKDDQKLPKLTRDTGRLAVEQIKGISSQVGAGCPLLLHHPAASCTFVAHYLPGTITRASADRP